MALLGSGMEQAREKGESCSGMMEGVRLELLSRSISLTGPLLRSLRKTFHLLIALAMLPTDGPFPPPSAGIILPIAGGSIV